MVSRILLVGLALACVLPAQGKPSPKARAAFEKAETKALWAAGQRHVKLGMWARKIGLNAQATKEFMVVREVSNGINTGGDFLLRLQRQYGDKFWKGQLAKIPKKYLKEYARRVKIARKADRKDYFKIATFAHKQKHGDIAMKYFKRLVRTAEQAATIDEKGQIVLDVGKVPADYAVKLDKETVEIGGEKQVRDELLANVPAGAAIHVADGEQLRVRSQLSEAQAGKMQALLTKALPRLEEAVGGTPTRKLEVFVFAKRADFQEYVRRAGYGETTAFGLMDPHAFGALLCAEGLHPALVRSLALHELAHLYDYAVSRAVFPSWYAEAFAETYGGIGTFKIADDKLELGGVLDPARLKPLAADGGMMPLREMLAMDRARLMQAEAGLTDRFYAQSWAFLRFLRSEPGTAEKLALWEARCRGAAVGAEVGKPRAHNQNESVALFDKTFGDDLPRLEGDFRAWLRALVAR